MEHDENDRKFDQNQLADSLREILCNHTLPFKDRVREITNNQDMYDYVLNILDDLVLSNLFGVIIDPLGFRPEKGRALHQSGLSKKRRGERRCVL